MTAGKQFWERVKNYFLKLFKDKNFWCLLSVILLLSIWAILMFNRSAPANEGWYSAYAKAILAGKVPYRDFELVYPPLFSYYCAAVFGIFGEYLIAFRVLGAITAVLAGVVLYLIFKLFFKPHIAAAGTLLVMFTTMGSGLFNFNDYHIYLDLFTYLAIYISLRTFCKLYKGEHTKTNLNMFLTGVCVAITSQLHQLRGFLLIFSFIVLLILSFFFVKEFKLKQRNIWVFLSGILVPYVFLFIGLLANGIFGLFFQSVYNASSKGSFGSILFGWFIPAFNKFAFPYYLLLPLAGIFAYFLIKLINKNGKRQLEEVKNVDYYIYYAICVAFAIVLIVTFFTTAINLVARVNYNAFMSSLTVISFLLTAIFAVFYLVRIIRSLVNRNTIQLPDVISLVILCHIAMLGVGIAFASGNTIGRLEPALGFFLCLSLENLSLSKVKDISRRVLMAGAFCFMIVALMVKFTMPFSWWIISDRSSMAKHTTDIKYFSGIKMTEREKNAYEDFVRIAKKTLGPDDEIYCTHYTMLFYNLANKAPSVYAIVPWMDVSSDKALARDFEHLEKKPPKMIVLGDFGDFGEFNTIYYDVHEYFYRDGKRSKHRDVFEWIIKLHHDGTYAIAAEHDIGVKIRILVRTD